MRRQTLMISALFLVLLLAGSSWSATLDPLLRGLSAEKDDGPRLLMERCLAIDPAKDASDPMVGVILHVDGPFDTSSVPGLVPGTRRAGLMTATVPLSSLPWLEASDEVSHVEAARLLRPSLDVAVPAGHVDDVWSGAPAYTGEGVLVGVIDSGIDHEHEDFRAAGGDSRILYLFDQHINGTHPTGFDYGAEFDAADIEAGSVNQQDLMGHGTHVAGIAAGDGSSGGGTYSGVAPGAELIVVKSFDDALGGFPENMTIDALNYLADKAEDLGRPMVVNMSLGGHMGPHDGTSAQERIIDDISGTGLVVCVAAGNEGEAYLHHSGPAADTVFELTVPAYTPVPGTGNDYVYLNLWYDGATSPTITVGRGGTSVGPVASGSSEGDHTGDGTVVIDNASGGVDAHNGDKQVIIQIDDQGGTPPTDGTWTIRIQGGSGTAHVWVAVNSMGAGFGASSQTHSVGMPGTSEEAISVAAWKSRQTWPGQGGTYQYSTTSTWGLAEVGAHAPFSSIGPTRDGREKPDVSAPGMGLMAAYSSDTTPEPNGAWLSPDGHYYLSQGTSMASPYVAGVVALMLEKNGALTASEIRTFLRNTADTDSHTGTVWNGHFGAGKVDALGAVQAVSLPGPAPTGDVNGDEAVSILDLVVLVNHIVDPSGHPLDADAREQADVYPAPGGDSLLNASDLARIVAFILEQDEPGKSVTRGHPVDFTLKNPISQDGRWWQPVTISGEAVAAGQFVLRLDGALWQPEDLQVSGDVAVSTRVEGQELRVMFYGLSGDVARDGLRLEIPFSHDGERPVPATAAGVLMAAPGGDPLPVREETAAPAFWLRAAPNPARGDMRISFARDSASDFDLSVYDVRGRQVRSLVGGVPGDSGQVVFDGRGDDGRHLPAGLYFLVYRSDDRMTTQKIVLTR